MDQIEKTKGLPENAQRELKPGETYEPIMSPNQKYLEATPYSVIMGVLMAILFSAAAAYLGLKVGQVFEAAIPIAIIAVGASNLSKKKNALGQNVIIQSIGASSGVIVAGAIFTLPALYILQAKYPELSVSFMQVFMSSLLGGILGILFLIPFRKYFVSDMHGKYPFPEATATTQVLVSGEKGGNQAKFLLVSGLIGGLYDFFVSTFGWWNENFTSRVIPYGEVIAEKAKVVFKVNIGAALLGLGYIIGLQYAAIITFGSLFVWFIIIPLMSLLFGGMVIDFTGSTTMMVGQMSPELIFTTYARHIGIGGIAMAGLIGIFRSRNIIKSAFGLAANELSGKTEVKKEVRRTERDLSMKFIAIGLFVALAIVFIFFQFGVVHNLLYAVVGLLVVAIIAFLFTTVAANAIAIVGTNPVSGMTLMTLILASLVMVATGLTGTAGMVAALVIGGVVCTALAMAGGFITDLKIGYWLGSTPSVQQKWKFLGTLVSAATVGGVIMVLNKTYGFVGENALVAPQANAMAAVIEPLMMGQSAPWILYGIGAGIALILAYFNVPALAFALGMFIPLQLNTPLLIGGALAWFVSTRSKNEKLNTARKEKGTLLASGFIAGGALMGVVAAVIKFKQSMTIDSEIEALGTGATSEAIHQIKESHNFINAAWADSNAAIWLGAFMLAVIGGYIVWSAMKAKPEEE
ncbi:OPT family oligopeptide transporter [Williamwhitmania taraxaci]|uniref:Putative oligopeptide transporter, OPT family n=1 Tax=Williamwhitmania taraxaci TaxID=1640674 RepID=A0A1G6QND4_9BACT|nr:oligopeptide transporter, OPT family [Williamwhitmania taraxaci]SDC93574.1 putative oligopeptide transporter, OPT family [Williamwhitmania taraxaci]